jgi:hypothetical protein
MRRKKTAQQERGDGLRHCCLGQSGSSGDVYSRDRAPFENFSEHVDNGLLLEGKPQKFVWHL